MLCILPLLFYHNYIFNYSVFIQEFHTVKTIITSLFSSLQIKAVEEATSNVVKLQLRTVVIAWACGTNVRTTYIIADWPQWPDIYWHYLIHSKCTFMCSHISTHLHLVMWVSSSSPRCSSPSNSRSTSCQEEEMGEGPLPSVPPLILQRSLSIGGTWEEQHAETNIQLEYTQHKLQDRVREMSTSNG